jgi:hypothetical protein
VAQAGTAAQRLAVAVAGLVALVALVPKPVVLVTSLVPVAAEAVAHPSLAQMELVLRLVAQAVQAPRIASVVVQSPGVAVAEGVVPSEVAAQAAQEVAAQAAQELGLVPLGPRIAVAGVVVGAAAPLTVARAALVS